MSLDLPILPLTQGTSRRWIIRLGREDDLALSFLGTETLEARLWPGDNRAPVPLTCEWVAAPDKVRLTINPTDTAALEPGRYRLQIRIVTSDGVIEAARATIALTAGPGTATAPKVYCGLPDLASMGPRR